jgi:hypothetical protein
VVDLDLNQRWKMNGPGAAQQRRGAKDSGKLCKTAGAVAEEAVAGGVSSYCATMKSVTAQKQARTNNAPGFSPNRALTVSAIGAIRGGIAARETIAPNCRRTARQAMLWPQGNLEVLKGRQNATKTLSYHGDVRNKH